jgi:hypothetical protein
MDDTTRAVVSFSFLFPFFSVSFSRPHLLKFDDDGGTLFMFVAGNDFSNSTTMGGKLFMFVAGNDPSQIRRRWVVARKDLLKFDDDGGNQTSSQS